MSRKTRKLIWSAPLVAVLAVAGALAIFAALSPQEATAHEAAMHGAPNPVSGLMATVATGNDAMGQPAGRTQINLTWMAPAASTMNDMGAVNAGMATSYRIDYSSDTRVWRNLVGGEESDTSLMDTSADMYCGTDAADAMRCFTDMTLTPGERRHYRVFAVNEFGTSPVSINPTYHTATAMNYGNPSAVLRLTASTTRRDEIELNWQAPTDLGGATLLFYCLAVGTSTAAANIPDLTDETNQGANCLNVDKATAEDAVPVYTGDPLAFPTAGGAIVVDGDTTTFTHKGLGKPDTVSLYYRVYAVTDKDGDPDTANSATDPVVTDDRRISLAASNTANGRTIAPLPTVDTSVTATPGMVRNLRHVVDNGTGSTYSLRLYWTPPSNYPPAIEGAESPTNPDLRANWLIEVSIWDPDGDSGAGAYTVLTNGTNAAVEQWTSSGTEVDALGSGPQQFRIRYVNDPTEGETPDPEGDEVPGQFSPYTIGRALDEKFNTDNLPNIVTSSGNDTTGLRFRHNDQNPTTWLDLDWNADTPSATDNNDVPTGYGIDVSEDGGTTWHPIPDAIDLGATTRYTHKNVVPGKEYDYRVFPEFGGIFGPPARVDASTRAGDLPDPVRGLKVEADGQKKLKLTWPAVQNKRGSHEVLGYLVQIAPPTVAANTTKDRPAAGQTWVSLTIQEDTDTTAIEARPYSVPADTLMYTYDGKAEGSALGADDPLGAGQIRWFRVIAINAENDDDDNTGGAARNVDTGAEVNPPSPSEASPHPNDILGADWKYGMTAGPNAAGDPDSAMLPPKPVDVTAEKASDTNLIDATDRGVLLLWNEPEDGDEITSYVIERKIGTGDWTAIGTIEWSSAQSHLERTAFSDSREYIAGEDLYYRVGSRGSSAVGANYSSEMGIKYPTTHPESHDTTLGNAMDLTAMNNGDGTVTLMWTPGPNANIHWVGAARRDGAGFDTATGSTVWEKADMAGSHTVDVSSLTAGTYAFTVIAGQYDEATSMENWDSAWTDFEDVTVP